MKGQRNRLVRTFLAGLLALLPVALTIGLLVWVGRFLHRLLGPESFLGKILSGVGLAFVTNEMAAYLFGALLLMIAIYILGLLVQSRLRPVFEKLLHHTVRRLPLIGGLYDTADRFVAMFKYKERADYGAMHPVWCFFGGEGGTAVLALMPNPNPIVLAGHSYHAILVPSAPVPVGGGLLYVPAAWVKPADFGVEAFTTVYMSMGITNPPGSTLIAEAKRTEG